MSGELYIWGLNNFTYVPGYPGTIYGITAPAVYNTVALSSLSASRNHGCGLDADGYMWGWGVNATYDIPGNTSYTQELCNIYSWLDARVGLTISTGAWFLGIRSDGTLWAQGSNLYGQLGQGTISSGSGVPLVIGDQLWSKISASQGGHALAIRSDGTLWAWGNNSEGQIASGSYGGSISTPRQIGHDIDFEERTWVYIWASPYSTFAIDNFGALYAAGDNSYGTLGNGSTTRRTVLTLVATDVAKVFGSSFNTFIIKTDGSLWGCGGNANYQLGTGNTTPSTIFIKIDDTKSWHFVACDNHCTVAIDTSSKLWGWGKQDYGSLGLPVENNGTILSTPTSISSLDFAEVYVSYGSFQALGGPIPTEEEYENFWSNFIDQTETI